MCVFAYIYIAMFRAEDQSGDEDEDEEEGLSWEELEEQAKKWVQG